MSASTWPGPTEGNWSTSPTTSRAAVFGTALSSACISSTSTMDVSSTMSRSQSRGFSPSRRNPPVLGSTSSSRWMVLASKPVASFMRLAARPVEEHSKSLAPLAERMRRMALTRVVLPTPRPAGDHQHLGRQCQRHGRPLASGEYQTRPLLDPGDRLVRINPGPWQRAGPQLQQPLGDAPLRPVQAGEEHATLVADLVGSHRAFSQFEVKGGEDQRLGNLDELFGQRHEVVGRQAAMALVHRLGQRIGDTGAHADHGSLVNAELHRDGIGGLEANAADVACQAIGILRHDLHGIAAIGLVNAHRPSRADPMAVQEDHDLADRLLLGPGGRDAAGAHRTDAIHLPQTIWFRFDDIEHLLAEGAQELLGIHRADAADHSRREILLDALKRGGRRGLEEPSFELLTVSTVVNPVARCRDPLTGRDRGGMANQGDQLAVATSLNPQDAKTVLGVLVSDALDQSGEHLAIRLRGLALHDGLHTLAVL